MNYRGRWVRLAGALLGAVALAFVGFAAFVQSIHDPGTFNAVLQALGLPFFEMGARAGLFWVAIVASVAFWTLLIYALLGAYAWWRAQGGRAQGPPLRPGTARQTHPNPSEELEQ